MKVGCIIHENLIDQIHKWRADPEIILLIVVYGSNDNTSNNKNKFWKELTLVVEEAKWTMFVVGHSNSKVGVRDDEYICIMMY